MPFVSAELIVDRLSQLGEGVASFWGRSVFVPGALPGERVRARFDPRAKVLHAELSDLVERSPARRASFCPVSDRCGGCDWIHLDEAGQLAAKREIVLSTLEHVGGFERARLTELTPIASPQPIGYRSRAVLHVAGDRLGFFGRKSHDRVPIDRCPALTSPLEALPGTLASVFQPILHDLEEVRIAATPERTSIALVLKTPVKERHLALAETARRSASLDGIVLVPKEGSPQLVGRPALPMPAPLAEDVRLFVRPDAFFQANATINVALVEAALEQTPLQPNDRVLELFSGNGNFTFALARRCREVIAVESSSVALDLARRSAADARITNVRFVQSEAEKVCEGLAKEGTRFDWIVADPPRAGAKGLAGWASRLGARGVTYVACDPAALARDARELAAAGYAPRSLRVLDLFPQTRHVEAIMVLDNIPEHG